MSNKKTPPPPPPDAEFTAKVVIMDDLASLMAGALHMITSIGGELLHEAAVVQANAQVEDRRSPEWKAAYDAAWTTHEEAATALSTPLYEAFRTQAEKDRVAIGVAVSGQLQVSLWVLSQLDAMLKAERLMATILEQGSDVKLSSEDVQTLDALPAALAGEIAAKIHERLQARQSKADMRTPRHSVIKGGGIKHDH